MALAAALAGCQTDDLAAVSARALKPVPPELAAEIDRRNMPRESPILVRIFKEESELEVWKQDSQGRYALLKTYPICRWSGELGPKVKLGDRQAPEGFYQITPGQMNPNSNYYLAFNLGFPNAYDKANDFTGDFLMVHGDCSSAGCYAMTDEQIQEIYALGRDAFLGGQKSFQVQAFPFRMTPLNLAKHRDNPNMAFWRMIKEGSDYFELTKTEPHVEVCEKHYVFSPRAPGNASTPLVFHPREQCPAYEMAPDVAAAMKAKEAGDDRAVAELVRKGVATVAVRTGTDGGMHPLFLAKLQGRSAADPNPDVKAPPGPLPAHTKPPHAPEPQTSLLSLAMPGWMTASPAPASAVTTSPAPAPAAATAESGTSTMGTISRWLGFGGQETPPPPPAPPPPAPRSKSRAVTTAANKPKAENRTTETAQAPSA
ncbi:MAG: murein L,D-transpeptidase, partial [Bradyrhizobiaceae bacterium]|nr:murein L,D-transpeptidase [Bradyrhizobiaceae bacterium]